MLQGLDIAITRNQKAVFECSANSTVWKLKAFVVLQEQNYCHSVVLEAKHDRKRFLSFNFAEVVKLCSTSCLGYESARGQYSNRLSNLLVSLIHIHTVYNEIREHEKSVFPMSLS